MRPYFALLVLLMLATMTSSFADTTATDTRAHLRVATMPAGAAISADGVKQPGPSFDVDLGEQRYRPVTIIATLDGYKSFCATIVLTQGASTDITVKLEPVTSTVTPTRPPAPIHAVAPAIVPTNSSGKRNMKDQAEMVYVPAGPFTMGTDQAGDFKTATPSHTVYLDGYWIYKYTVTVEQYQKFCKATGRIPAESVTAAASPKAPVVGVTWDEAAAYASWAGGQLPTEAQWEKAARGTDARTYPWGNDWDTKRCVTAANYSHASAQEPAKADLSPYGAANMVGNVYQWCNDYFASDYYQASPANNPQGPESGSSHVMRGGSFANSFSKSFTTFARSCDIEGSTHNDRGFRVVIPAP